MARIGASEIEGSTVEHDSRGGDASAYQWVALSRLRRARSQPRLSFREDQLEELAASIREHGILEPIIVRPTGDTLTIICGERRFRAATLLELTMVPVRVMEVTEQQAYVLAVHENVHRDSLSLLEEAQAYRRLLQAGSVRTQLELARLVGVSQGRISQRLSLLDLPPDVVEVLEMGSSNGGVTERHARALGRIRNPADRAALLTKVISDHLTAEETENAARDYLAKKGPIPRRTAGWVSSGQVRYRVHKGRFLVEVARSDRSVVVEELESLIAALKSDQ